MSQILTVELQKKADQICTHYPVKRAALLPVLHLVQETYGCISGEAELEVAAYFEISPADVREVVTFYTLFYSKPKGQCHVQICRTLSCYLRGSAELIRYAEERLGIRAGETTSNGKVSLDQVECMGACEIAPMAKIDADYVGPLTKEKLNEVIDNRNV
jgi:NADH-quinone oxidoreductase subunit E